MPAKGPRYLQFFPTLRCNFSCAVCFNREHEIPPDMSLDEYVRLVSVMSDHGIGEIDIIGGEPTLHEYIGEIIETSCRVGIRTTISTNGSQPWLLEEISDRSRGPYLRIGLSLYRGKEPSSGLHRFIVNHRPALKSVTTSDSFVPEFAERYLGLPGIRYYLIYMDALNKEDASVAGTFPNFYDKLGKVRALRGNIEGVFCSGFIASGKGTPELKETRCPAGTTKLSIMPTGDVYPCYLLFHDHSFRIGNIFSDSFSSIWSSPVLSFFREARTNPCPLTECHLHFQCKGGCPAVSLRVSGEIGVADPRCNVGISK